MKYKSLRIKYNGCFTHSNRLHCKSHIVQYKALKQAIIAFIVEVYERGKIYKMNDCVIKWTGSKRTQASKIVDMFPDNFETYYEPFIGGGSILIELLNRHSIKFNRIICSDINNDLINLWILIKQNPTEIIEQYTKRWLEMQSAHSEPERKEIYLHYRDRYNTYHDVHDFYFVRNTCYNGMVRYNSDGHFNVGYHFHRSGANPNLLENILINTNYLLNKFDIKFICQQYDKIRPDSDDFCYFDPPYEDSKSLYTGDFNNIKFIDFVNKLNCKWLLSYDGDVENSSEFKVIEKLNHKNLFLLNAGISSYRKLKNIGALNVREALYTNYDIGEARNLLNYSLF